MTRYFFHLWTGAAYERDDHGSDLPHVEAAYMEAFEAAQDLAIDLIRSRENAALRRFDVVDEQGRIVFELPFTEVVGTRASKHPVMETLLRGRALAADVAEQVVVARQNLDHLRLLLSSQT